MSLDYCNLTIKRLPDYRKPKPTSKKNRKFLYSQRKAGELMNVPKGFIRLMLDAGRLDCEYEPMLGSVARMVVHDSKKWHDCKKAWAVIDRQRKQLK